MQNTLQRPLLTMTILQPANHSADGGGGGVSFTYYTALGSGCVSSNQGPQNPRWQPIHLSEVAQLAHNQMRFGPKGIFFFSLQYLECATGKNNRATNIASPVSSSYHTSRVKTYPYANHLCDHSKTRAVWS